LRDGGGNSNNNNNDNNRKSNNNENLHDLGGRNFTLSALLFVNMAVKNDSNSSSCKGRNKSSTTTIMAKGIIAVT